MGTERFKSAIDVVLRNEGGYVDNPSDPGGETNYGITWPTLRDAIAFGVVPAGTTIAKLTQAQAEAIYYVLYWQRSGAEMLALPFDLLLLDAAVNHGVTNAVKQLQRAIGDKADGIVGARTIAACKYPSPIRENHAIRFLVERAWLYHGLSLGKDMFYRGWMRRLFELHAESLKRTA